MFLFAEDGGWDHEMPTQNPYRRPSRTYLRNSSSGCLFSSFPKASLNLAIRGGAEYNSGAGTDGERFKSGQHLGF